MPAKPKAGVLTHSEVSDVDQVMDALEALNCDRGCKVVAALVTLDTGRDVEIKYSEDERYEVSLHG